MSQATRRAFVAGAAASLAAPVVAKAAPGAAPGRPEARPEPVLRGRALAVSPHGGRIVIAHDQRRTIAIRTHGSSTVVDVGGQPVAVAVSPDGRVAAVATAFWDTPGLVLVDLRHARLIDHVAVGPAPTAVAFTRDGSRIVVVGGEQEGTVHVLDAKRFAVLTSAPIGMTPRGLATGPRADRAWVALNGDDRIVELELRRGGVRRTHHTAPLPDSLAVSPDGRRLLVSHGRAATVSEIDRSTGATARHRAGRQPAAVAWTQSAKRLATLAGQGSVAVLRGSRAPKLLRAGGAPRGLAVAGRRAWTVDALSGELARVRV